LDIFDALNPAQAEAVRAVDGPVLVLAGPGSGKTRVLTHRIAYMVNSCDIHPYNILAMTFTNKAAKEMLSRIKALIGQDTHWDVSCDLCAYLAPRSGLFGYQ